MTHLTNEKKEIESQLTKESINSQQRELYVEELNNSIGSLKEEMSCKSLYCDKLNRKIIALEDECKAKAQELANTVSSTLADFSTLQNELQACSLNEISLREKLEVVEKEKRELWENLTTECNKTQDLESSTEEMKRSIISLEGELSNKSSELQAINNLLLTAKDEYEAKIHELETRLSSTQADVTSFQNELQVCFSNEKLLKEKLEVLEKEKADLTAHLQTETDKVHSFESNCEKLKENMISLEGELSIKSSELQEVNNLMFSAKVEYEAKAQELANTVSSTLADFSTLQNELQVYSSNEILLKEKLEVVEKENKELWENLATECNKAQDLESSTEEMKRSTIFLEGELSNKSSELQAINSLLLTAKDEYETKIEELENRLSSTQANCSALLKDLQVCSLDDKLLKEKLEVLETEKRELSEHLAMESNKSQSLESSIEDLKKLIVSLEEELSKKSSELHEINNLFAAKKDCEAKAQELEITLSSTQTDCSTLQNDLQICLSNDKLLKEKLEVLESEKRELSEHLAMESNKSQSLESSTEDLQKIIEDLEEELFNKSSELEESNNLLYAAKEDYEQIIQSLEASLYSEQEKYTALENQLNECSVKDKYFKEKILMLETEINVNREIESSMESQKGLIMSLKGELADKSLEFDELQNQLMTSKNECEKNIQDLESKLSLAQEALKFERRSSMQCVKQQLEVVTQEKKELADLATVVINKNLVLESSIQELKGVIFDTENKLSLAVAEQSDVNKKLQECLEKENSFIENIEYLHRQKKELAENLAVETCKSQDLKLRIENWKMFIMSLENDFSLISSEHEILEKQVLVSQNNYEDKIQKLEAKLAASESQCIALELQLAVCSSNEHSSKEALQQLAKEGAELFNLLAVETSKIKAYESTTESLKKEMALNEEKLSFIAQTLEEANEGERKIVEYECKIQDFENKLCTAKKQQANFQSQLQEYVLKEASLEESLQLMEKKKNEVVDCLDVKISRCENLEFLMEELKITCDSLENELIAQMLQFDEVTEEKDILYLESKDQVQYLESRLAAIISECSDLKSEQRESVLNGIEFKQKLDLVTKEKDELAGHMTEVTNRNLQLESSMEEMKDQFQNFKSEQKFSALNEIEFKQKLDLVTKEKDELAGHVTEVTNRNLQLESSMEEMKAQVKKLENELAECLLKETSLLEKLNIAEKESDKLAGILKAEVLKIGELESINEKLKDSLSSLEKESVLKSSKCEEITSQLKEEYEERINLQHREFKKSLDIQSINSHQEINELLLKFESFEEKVESLDREKREIVEHLNAEINKTKELESIIEELKKTNASLEKELKLKLSQVNEFNQTEQQMVIRMDEQQRTIQNLQDGISAVQSENTCLETRVADSLLNEKKLKKELDFVEIEKQKVYNQLRVEASKIKILELGIGELKRIIMTLQVLLTCNNGDTSANIQITATEDCSEVLNYERNNCVDKLQIQGSKNCKNTFVNHKHFSDTIPATSTDISYPAFDLSKLTLPESLKAAEHAQVLKKHALHSLNEICSLEHDLIEKFKKCQFLCSYKLVERKELSRMWKTIFALVKRLKQIQLLKKFMFCICTILKSNAMAVELDSVNRMLLITLFPKNLHLALQDFFYLCGNTLNKLLFSVSQTLQKNKANIEKHSVYFINEDIHSNDLHLPIIQKTNYIMYLHNMYGTYANSTLKMLCQNPRSENNCKLISVRKEVNIQKVLKILNVQDVPSFLNFAIALSEYILKLCGETNSVLCLEPPQSMLKVTFPSSLSPVLHLLRYHFDSLNPENGRILEEVSFWKTHCNTLGISECDMLRIISPLEHNFKNDQMLKKNAEDMAKEIKCLEKEYVAVKVCKETLENAVKTEKEKQQLLNATIEEIERDLGETFQQKESYKEMALQTSKMLMNFRKHSNTASTFSFIEFENGISDKFCFCEKCILQEDEINCSHEKLTFKDCLQYIKRLVNVTCQLENDLSKFKQSQPDLKNMYDELLDKNFELETIVTKSSKSSKTASDEIENLKYELQKQKEKYVLVCQFADKKDTLILELESMNSNLSDAIDQCNGKLKICEEQILKLSTDHETLTIAICSKEDEINTLRKAIEEGTLKNETICFQCVEYENRIHLLNSTLSKFEEEKALDFLPKRGKVDNESSKQIISELQSKIDSLKKSNESLNLTTEGLEENLKNVYLEKKSILEELEKLSEQTTHFKEEVSMCTQKYICEQKTTEELLRELKEFEKLKVTSDSTINQLRVKNERLEKDVNILKGVQRDHEQAILEKNSSLKKNSLSIEQLKLKISELDQEKLDLKVNCEVETEELLKLQLKEISQECSALKKEITRLKLVEEEKAMILVTVNEMKLQMDDLIEGSDVLRRELRMVNEQLKDHENRNMMLTAKCEEADEESNSAIVLKTTKLESELLKKETCIFNLNVQLQEFKTTIEKFKAQSCELNSENCTLKQSDNVLKQKIYTLKKDIKNITAALKNAELECNNKEQLFAENNNLKARLTETLKAGDSSELHAVKMALNNAVGLIINILDAIIKSIESYSDYPNIKKLKSGLVSLMIHWKQKTEIFVASKKKLELEVFEDLKTFFKFQSNKYEEELIIGKNIKSIIDSVNNMGLFCESTGQKCETFSCAGDLTNMSLFDTTIIGNLSDRTKTNFPRNKLVTELQQTKLLLDEYFGNLKNSICKKIEETEMLKLRLNEMSSSKETSFKSQSSEESKNPMQWKYDLIKLNYRKLEKDYNQFVNRCKENEKHIKKLEMENKNLEEEAEELSNEIKQAEERYANSDELLNALKELTHTKQNLKDSENEVKWLKKVLQDTRANKSSSAKKTSYTGSQGTPDNLDESDFKENAFRKMTNFFPE